jgi:Ca2+-binding RTX toxin-like protein
MSDKVETSGQTGQPGGDAPAAAGKPQVINVTFDKKGSGTTVIQVHPGDTVNMHGLDLNHAKIDIVGRDVIITDKLTGQKIVLPELGLIMFSPDAPDFNFDDQNVNAQDLLSHVGVVNNMTEKDFVAFGTTPIDQGVDAKALAAAQAATAAANAKAAAATAAAAAAQAAVMVISTPATSAEGDYTQPPVPEPDPLLIARQSLLDDNAAPPEPPAAVTNPGAPPAAANPPNSAKAGSTFDFTATLLQVPAIDNTGTLSATYLGGNGSAQAALNGASNVQFSTQIIDETKNSGNITINANNPTYFTTVDYTRVISIAPSLPDGFTVTQMTLTGLPAGYSILGATNIGGNTYLIPNPTMLANNTIQLLLEYPPTDAGPFTLTMSLTADFTNPTGQFKTPNFKEFTLAVTKTVETIPVNSPADYSFTDDQGNPGWVLATNLNANKILAGSGNETIYGGSGSNTIQGGAGNDLIYGGSSNDSIIGGSGNNYIYVSLGSDYINGGVGGSNTLDYTQATVASLIDILGQTATGYATDVLSNFTTILGSNFGDTIRGSAGSDSIVGGTGGNYIYATTGSDTINGGLAVSGKFNTINFSGATSGSLIDLTNGTTTGFATDTLSNFTTVVGSNFGDTIIGTTGNDSITGGSGRNLVYATLGTDTLNGGSGISNTIDFINATAAVTVNLATGTATGFGAESLSNFNIVIASNNGDSITGNGHDTIYGGIGNDSIAAGGNAVIYASLGSDTINGGTGSNTINFSLATHDVVANLTNNTATGWGTDVLNNFTTVVGSNFGDTITGTTGNDLITGGSTKNYIYATSGADTINGGQGAGGSNIHNTIDFSSASAGSLIDLTGGTTTGFANDAISNFTTVVGSNHGDTIRGTTGNDSITGGTGGNYIYITAGTDTINGGLAAGGKFNTIDFSAAPATSASLINLGTGTATGFATDSIANFTTVIGSNANDTILGSAGNDSIRAGTGNDYVYATLGSDTVAGSTIGHDTLSFTNMSHALVIHLDSATQTASDTFSDSTTFSHITSFVGSNHGDTIFGSSGSDSILGGSGNNLFYASLGTDTLNGGVGGTNTIDFINDTTAAVVVNLTNDSVTGYGTGTLVNFQNVIGSNAGNTITGSAGNNNITGGTGADLFYVSAGTDTINGISGNDTLAFTNMTLGQTINLGTGSSTDTLGDRTNFSNITNFNGSNHNDTIFGSTGNDIVIGGTGGANLFYASLGTDSLDGGTANASNTIDFALASSAVTVNLTNQTATGWGTDTLLDFNNVIASAFGDNITGSTGNDSIVGGVGNDMFIATGGNDTINGVSGTDTLNLSGLSTAVVLRVDLGSAIDQVSDVTHFSNIGTFFGTNHGDTIFGSTASDNIQGGTGVNIFYASLGSDTLNGGNGTGHTNTIDFANETVGAIVNLTLGTASGFGADTLSNFNRFIGGDHGDTVTGTTSNDTLTGGQGADMFYATLGSDSINGGLGTPSNTINFANAGTHQVVVNLGSGTATGFGTDTLTNIQNVIGTNNGDTITGSTASNSIQGGTGNDIFYASLGNDTYGGGGGSDTLSYSTLGGGITLDIAHGTSTDGANDTDSFNSITTFIGTDFGDKIFGSTGNDSVQGGAGTNIFYASLGSDTFNGGTGGSNTIDFVLASNAVYVDLGQGTATGWGTDTFTNFQRIIGSNFGDTLNGSANADSITGGTGSDLIYATLGGDTLNGGTGAGINTVDFAHASNGVVINLTNNVASGWGVDTISNFQNVIGSGFGDTITGSTGNNSIRGGAGSDIFYATAGSDTITGGGGTDTLSFSGMASAVTLHLDGTPSGTDSLGDITTFSAITSYVGSNHNDTIYGSTGNDSVMGGTSGHNMFYASLGADTLDGGVATGANANTISFLLASAAVTVNLGLNTATGWGTDTLTDFQNVIASTHGDTITGNGQNNSITGGTGNDLFYASLGNDTYVGGGGTDTLNYSSLGTAITLDLANATSIDGFQDVDSFSGVKTFIGTNHGDTIFGSSGNDSVLGGGGNDLFYASLGTDTLDGGGGTSNTLSFALASSAVTINMATGSATGWGTSTFSEFQNVIASSHGDTIFGSTLNDNILGGIGADHIYASAGNDTLNGGTTGAVNTLDFSQESTSSLINLSVGTTTGFANDTISNFNIVIGSTHGDTIIGTNGNDTITGGAAANLIYATPGTDVLSGGANGNDTLTFATMNVGVTLHIDTGTVTDTSGDKSTFSGFSNYVGSAHNDTVFGSTGNDSVLGGSGGANLFYASLGSDTLDGGVASGTNTNTINFSLASSSVTINLAASTATGWGTDTLTDFQNVVGSSHGDLITGNAQNNSILGGAGNDVFYASLGNDSYNGGGGVDTLNYSSLGTSITLDLAHGTSTDTFGDIDSIASNINRFVGTNSGDTIFGSTGNDSVQGGSTANLFYISAGTDTLLGGSSNASTLNLTTETRASFVDLTAGTATGFATDTLSGFTTVIGSASFSDTIRGSTGSDSIQGGTGTNLFLASLGADTINGGGVGTNNTISFAAASNAVTVNLSNNSASGWGTDRILNVNNVIASTHGDTITGSTGNDSIAGGTGNDLVYTTTGTDTVTGGGGTDTLSFTGMATGMTIHLNTGSATDIGGDLTTFSAITSFVGSNNNDTIFGSTGNDSVRGGTSGHNMFYASLGADTLDGGIAVGTNANAINFSLASAAVTVNLTQGTATGWGTDTLTDFQNVVASSFNDTITGNAQNNLITGGSGNDLFYATLGNDSYTGGTGTDTLNYSLLGGPITLNIGQLSSTDSFGDTDTFTSAIKTFVGTNNGDTIYGSTANDSVQGGGAANLFYISAGRDTLAGGSSNASTLNLTTETSASFIDLTAGTATGFATDTLSGFTTVIGSASLNDTIRGSTGSDSIQGGTGTNLFLASLGADTINGGGVGTNNTISFAAASNAVTVNLSNNSATGWGTDHILNINNVIASTHGDTITGSTGNDSIAGGTGNDLVYTTTGTDTVTGGGGTDTLSFAGMAGAITVHLNTGSATDGGGDLTTFSAITSFVGSNNNDTIFGSTGNDSVRGGTSGHNMFYASLGTDTLDGGIALGTNANTINFSLASAAVTVNLASNTATGWGTDTLTDFQNVVASTHGDTITGNGQNNSMTGGAGNDLFYASLGNDSYTGGGGTDTLNYSLLGGPITLNIGQLSSTDSFGDTDTYANISAFVGTDKGDTIFGSTGNDNVRGGGSNNLFHISAGSDTLNGGTGTSSNTLSLDTETSASVINLVTGHSSGFSSDTLSNFTTVLGGGFSDTITGSTGNDVITGGAQANYIYGTTGHDTLNGGSTDNSTLDFSLATIASTINLTTSSTSGYAFDQISNFTTVIGSAWNDIITGSTGNDSILGGAGADIFYVSTGSDTINGGVGGIAGSDTLRFDNLASSPVILHLDASTAAFGGNTTTFTNITTFIGSNNGDTVYGSTGNDNVQDGSGSNLFYASLGSDTYSNTANAFNTNIIDFKFETAAINVNLGLNTATGWGTDTLLNFNNIIAGSFNDTITGNINGNSITGGSGNDLFYGSLGNDTYVGGSGTDTLNYSPLGGAITLFLAGHSTTDGSGDVDIWSNIANFVGTNNGDTVYGSTGHNSVLGGSGFDYFYASTGSDTFNGGTGSTNTIDFSLASTAVNVNLLNSTVTSWGSEVLTNFQTVVGGSHGDTITGTTGADSITGGIGNDIIYVTPGSDTLNGGAGVNTLALGSETAASYINLTTGSATGYSSAPRLFNFTVVSGAGSTFADTILGSTGNDTITGGSANDHIYASLGSDVLNGGGGTGNILDFSTATVASTINLTAGTTSGYANDTLSNFNVVLGSNNNDIFYGFASGGSDTINGGTGTNIFYDTKGTNNFYGGAGLLNNNEISFINSTNAVTANLTTGTATGWGTDVLSGFNVIVGANSTGDMLTGTTGNDTILGGTGNDTIFGTTGNDLLNGGAGTNTLNLSLSASAVTVSLASGTAAGVMNVNTTLYNLNTYIGSNHGDTIQTINSSVVQAGTGADSIYAAGTNVNINTGGGAGIDRVNLELTSANDTITANGNVGEMLYAYNFGATALVLNVSSATGTVTSGGANVASLTGFDVFNFANTTGNDTFTGFTSGSDTIAGGIGINLFFDNTGTNNFSGGLGAADANEISFVNSTNAINVSLLTGIATGWGTDTLSQFNVIAGSNHGDIITGSTGNDTILAGTGNDTIFGTLGNDVINGGAGTNTINMTAATSSVVIHLSTGTTAGLFQYSTYNSNVYNVTNYLGSNFGDSIWTTNGSTVVGGTGSDTFVVSGTNVSVNTGTGAGVDTVYLAQPTTNDTITGNGNAGETLDTYPASFGTTALVLNLSSATGTVTQSGTNVASFTGFNIYNFSNTGNDTVTGSSGNDNITTGAGADYFYATAGSDTLSAGTGFNTINFSAATSAMTINLATGTATGWGAGMTDSLSGFEGVIGGNFGDTITGYAGADNIQGGTTANWIYGSAGIDTINGGSAAQVNTIDFISATAKDTIDLSGGHTSGWSTDNISNFTNVIGGNLGDSIRGVINSTVTGGTGNDTITIEASAQNVNTGTGNNLVLVGSGTAINETITGSGGGNDTLRFDNASNVILHLDSTTTVYTDTGGNGTFTGFSFYNLNNGSNDTIYGSTGNDNIIGGHDNNLFYASLGQDTLNGSTTSGLSTIDFANAGTTVGVYVNLTTGTATGYGTDSLTDFRGVIGTNNGDTITGSSLSDSIVGGSGSDIIYLTAGSDTLNGGGGSTNTLYLTGATSSSFIDLTANLSTGYSSDILNNFNTVVGSTHGDTIRGTATNDSIAGGTSNDLIYATAGTDTYSGGGGTDTLNFSGINNALTLRIDLSSATNSHGDLETFTGFSVYNLANGSNNDTVYGGTGAYTVNGAAGVDYFYAGSGNDSLNGGTGVSNIIDFSHASSAVTINMATGSVTGWVTESLSGFNNVIGSTFGELFYMGSGSDTFTGGGGSDSLTFSSVATGVTLHLDTGSASDTGGDSLSFSGFNTYTLNNSASDTIYGAATAVSVTGGTAGDVFYASTGNDTFIGNGGADTLNYSQISNAVRLHLDTNSSVDANNDTITFSGFSTYNLANSGNDTVYGGTAVYRATGGSGANYFYVGSGTDTLSGGSGILNTIDFSLASSAITVNLNSSTVTGWSTDSISNFNKVIGSTSADLFYAATGSDTFTGGGGADSLNFSTVAHDWTVHLDTGTATDNAGTPDTLAFSGFNVFALGNSLSDTIYGSTGPVTVTGSTAGDLFYASTGNDSFIGNGGADTLNYSQISGAVTLNLVTNSSVDNASDTVNFSGFSVYNLANTGNDTVIGGTVANSVAGGSGINYFYASTGNDTFNGGSGVSNTISFANASSGMTINLASGTATGWATDAISNFSKVIGTASADTFYAGAGSDTFTGGGGIDTLNFSGVAHGWTVNIDGGTATDNAGTPDTLAFSGFGIYTLGNTVGDTIYGSTGVTTITGSTAGDLFYASTGHDSYIGGGGNDTLNYSQIANAVRLHLDTSSSIDNSNDTINFSGFTTYNLVNIGNDTIYGGTAANNVTGGSGVNYFYVGTGNDTFNGGTGGANTNTLSFANASSGMTINMSSGTATGWGTDAISNFTKVIGTTSADTFYAGAGSDTFTGGGGVDTLNFLGLGASNITLHLDTLTMTDNTSDALSISGFSVYMLNNSGADTVFGSAGADNVVGGSGIDYFYASLGSDSYNGGTSGASILDFSLASSAVTVNMVTGSATGWATDSFSHFNSIIGSSSNDLFYATNANDTFNGGTGGSDTLSYANLPSGSVNLNIGTGAATHTSNSTTDSFANIADFVGSNNGDTINGSSGADHVQGGSGTNLFYASLGSDTLDGGSGGHNTISFVGDTTSAVTVNLTTNIATGWGTDSMTHFQNVVASGAGGDTITGSTAANVITGGTGDYFYATTGSDTYTGGSGNTLDYTGTSGTETGTITGSSLSITKSADSSIDSASGVTNVDGNSGSSFTLDATAFASFNSLNGGGAGSTVAVNDAASTDSTVNAHLSSIFTNVGTLNLTGMTSGNDNWGTNITGSEIISLLGSSYNTVSNNTLTLDVAASSNLGTTLTGHLGSDGTYTIGGYTPSNNYTVTWTGAGNTVNLHVVAT